LQTGDLRTFVQDAKVLKRTAQFQMQLIAHLHPQEVAALTACACTSRSSNAKNLVSNQQDRLRKIQGATLGRGFYCDRCMSERQFVLVEAVILTPKKNRYATSLSLFHDALRTFRKG
jgi:hypothetical protein